MKKYTLVIDRSGRPVDIIDYCNCFKLFVKGNAVAIDTLAPDDNSMASFSHIEDVMDWINLPHANRYIPTYTASSTVPTPEVISLVNNDCKGMTSRRVQFNKSNLLLRDNYECAYCGKPLTRDNLTVDHVVPRASGGGTSWGNCVASCYKCNISKGSKDPVGQWKPKHRLYTPNSNSIKYNDLYKKFNKIQNPPESWKYYIK